MQSGSYHFVGVAGVGMSAVAQAALGAGCRVSGSDRHVDRGDDLPVLRQLAAAGVRLCAQDGSGVGPDTTGVVVSTAIEKDNPDLAAAQRLKVPVLHRSEMLAALVKGRRCVAVSGTSGKSTVTGMIGWMLEQVGADPFVVNGAAVLGWRSAARVGNTRCSMTDGPWVIEADESDRSLLNYEPDWAVITNVSKDHFSVEEAKELFRRFAARARAGCVSALDSPSLLDGVRPESDAGGSRFAYRGTAFRVPAAGRHNVENALLAVAACEAMGYPLPALAGALATFPGIERRLERVGAAGGVTVVDDCAHNPAKMRAAFEALAPHHRRVIGIWRPHGYGPLRNMLGELADCLGGCYRMPHRLLVLPVYDVGGTADRSTRSEQLVALLRERGSEAALALSPEEAEACAAGEAGAGDVVLVMGARDPWLPALARRILCRLESKEGRHE